MVEKTLYGLNKDGGYKTWKIEVDHRQFDGEVFSCIIINHGKDGGKMTEKIDRILLGKQGRSEFEQAVFEAESRIKKQVDKGYRENKEELSNLPLLAMLASDYTKVGHRIKFPCYTSVKYDGVRGMAFKKEGNVRIESRTGQLFSIPHLEEALCSIMKDGQYLDGEIYLHGYELQDILSAVKRTDPDKEIEKASKKRAKITTAAGLQQNHRGYEAECEQAWIDARRIKRIRENLEFHIFDIPTDGTFRDRIVDLDVLYAKYKYCEFIKFTQYDICKDEFHLKNVAHKDAVRSGFEGVMIRNLCGVYESGKRSGDLQKYKEMLDSEFEILDVVPDKQGYGIYVCKNDCNDLTFQVVMGSLSERKEALVNKNGLIGKYLTVAYQTRYKCTLLAQFPVGKGIREGEIIDGEFIPSV